MADDRQQQQQGDQSGSLLDQVKKAIEKSAKEAVKGKLTELMKKRMEHEKGIKLIDAEMTKIVGDFESGLA